MKPAQIRKKFLEFFAKHGHQVVASSPVIPAQDPTLLFTNAGMNQFKDLFLGNETRSYKRATSAQKCVRAGGKHNDLDQVGFTHRHLTFFEMLGNFSFGDYFKTAAIKFAWEFLTQDLKINPELLSVTVHLSDDESEQIWMQEIGLPKSRITRKGDADNFWQMGDTGPCGPCSEIFYDRGAQFDYQGEDERFVEIWNMVFMQYDRQADGHLKPLANCGVDTGMGFERLVTVLAGATNIFHTEVFAPLQQKIKELTGFDYHQADDKIKTAFNVLCDHIRSSSFIIADGAKPSNDGRGYVLRKIIRRALLFSRKLSSDKRLFASLVAPLVEQLGDVYQELAQMQTTIEQILHEETERFFSNLEKGEKIFVEFVRKAVQQNSKMLSGQDAFKLYDTYGFPLEITRIMAMEAGLEIDLQDYENHMQQQKEQSGKQKNVQQQFELPNGLVGEFVGYDYMHITSQLNWLGEIDASDFLWLCTEKNPFFAARGGQVSDTGVVKSGDHILPVLEVKELPTSATTKAVVLKVQGAVRSLAVGQSLELIVDERRRFSIAKNHTATHLVHAALRQMLGAHAKQAGSVVEPNYLRFDFNHDKALSPEQLAATEKLVNDWIAKNVNSNIFNTHIQHALELGADSIFGEKYNPERVRVVDYPRLSIELCGGTHLSSTGQVGVFKIISEESVGIGVRRIVALTGDAALEQFQHSFTLHKDLSQQLACKFEQVPEMLGKNFQKLAAQEKELAQLRLEMAQLQTESLALKFEPQEQFAFLFVEVAAKFSAQLKEMAQSLAAKKSAAVVFVYCSQAGDKLTFAAAAAADFGQRFDFAKLLPEMAAQGLRAGGKALFMQGGGSSQNIAALKTLLLQAIKKQLPAN